MVGLNVSFNASFFYWDNCPSKQEALWVEIINCSIAWETIPWILLGDFNAIRSLDGKCGGSTLWSGWQNDMGSRFTWTNRQSNNTILKKLDQVLVNVKWNSKFTGSKNCLLPFSISYHSPMLVKMVSLPKRKIPFKFFFIFGPIILFFSPWFMRLGVRRSRALLCSFCVTSWKMLKGLLKSLIRSTLVRFRRGC